MSRRVLITGASCGLGKVLTEALLSDGHYVAGCARTASAELESVHTESVQKRGTQFRFDSVDVTDDEAVRFWIEDVVLNWGTPDLVINNAGVINDNLPLWEVPVEQFQRVMRVNLQGVYSVIRHVMPHLLKAEHGVIANISSGWGRSVAAGVSPYCASKWGIEGLTRALAEDMPGGLAAVAVNPGVINTDMLQSFFGADASQSQDPGRWAVKALPFFLGLSHADNGKAMSV